MRALCLVAAGLALTSLPACQRVDRPVAGVCKPFPAANSPAPTEGATALEDCLHRWAYTLAPARDDAGQVAEAVLAACSAPLARWNQQGLAEAGAVEPPREAPSLLTGEPTNPIAQHVNFAAGRALFYVVQARAGSCRPPPKRSNTQPMTSPDR